MYRHLLDDRYFPLQVAGQSGDNLSLDESLEDATSLRPVRNAVDGDLVKVLSSLGGQLEAANNRIKELEELLRKEKEKTEAAKVVTNESKVEESCPLQSSQETVSLASTEEIVRKVEEKMSGRIKMLEAQSQQSMKELAVRTKELEDVQKELKENVELMSQRLNTIQQDNKANEVKIQASEAHKMEKALMDECGQRVQCLDAKVEQIMSMMKEMLSWMYSMYSFALNPHKEGRMSRR